MGRQIRARQEEAERQHQAVAALLIEHSAKVREPEPRVRPADQLMTPLMKEWWPFYLRDPKDWVCKTRSHDVGRQRLDLLRHLFQAYRVPRFLEALWEPDAAGRPHPEAREYLAWYVAVATGQSLYKECARTLLSRRETHLFLAAPDDFSPVQNVWWARAIAQGAPLGVARNIARSKLTRQPAAAEFWVAVMRFFVLNPVRLHEMEDLLDYLIAAKAEQPGFCMKGRSLESVRERSEDWHRLQAKHKEHGSGVWAGSALADWEHEAGNWEKGTHTVWRVRQIKTGRDLVKEGHAQHHCVGSYKAACVSGRSSIWSLTKESQTEGLKRALTLELDRHDTLVQARGYANRQPRPDEKAVLELWMRDRAVRRGAAAYW